VAKIVHRLWLGPRPMPQAYRDYGQAWLDLNSDWQLHDWSWHDLPEDLYCNEVLQDMRLRCTSGTSVEMPTAMADAISYELVYRFGGVYANADIQPIKPLDTLDLSSAWATYEEENYALIVNALFGAPEAEDPFWGEVVRNLPDNYFRLNGYDTSNLGVEMVFSTGPHHLTKIAEQLPTSLKVFPYYTTNPVLWKQVEVGSDATPVIEARGGIDSLPEGCIGIHHWGHKLTGRSNTVK
jgi:mannosyltransferase OCH1-like enzyme